MKVAFQIMQLCEPSCFRTSDFQWTHSLDTFLHFLLTLPHLPRSSPSKQRNTSYSMLSHKITCSVSGSIVTNTLQNIINSTEREWSKVKNYLKEHKECFFSVVPVQKLTY